MDAMSAYRRLLEVMKWVSPKHTLQHLSFVSRGWSRASTSKELWITYCEAEDIEDNKSSSSWQHHYRVCPKPGALAFISETSMTIRNETGDTEQRIPLSKSMPHSFKLSWVWVSRCQLLCCGGAVSLGHARNGSQAAYLIGNTGQVRRIANLSLGRWLHGIINYAGTCYVFGGISTTNKLTATAEKIDSRELRNWRGVASMNRERAGFNPCEHGGKIYLFGGYTTESEVFIPATQSYQMLPDILENLSQVCAIALDNEVLLLCDEKAEKWDWQLERGKTQKLPCFGTYGGSVPVKCKGKSWAIAVRLKPLWRDPIELLELGVTITQKGNVLILQDKS